MSDWDADDYVAPEPATSVKAVTINKWEGEDEEEDVKDNWEDEDNEEEKKDSEKPPEPTKSAASKKPKKNLAEKIQLQEEKERLLKEERASAQAMKNLTPAERQAEKLRQMKLQEESELELVKATYGVEDSDTPIAGIDSANPRTTEEFDQLKEAINNKIQEFSKSPHFVDFVTDLVQSMVVNLPVVDLKKLSANLTSLATEKAKMDKAATSKKKGGKFKGAKLKMDDRDLTTEIEYDDLDDFM
ncbi:hypothetical protein FOCC_FOCC000048 [Frankliniella occidentalis]|uniref:Eukaryotic translation initiation factor 3 subunit J n=1 Tax=Frankliniella occidentalis TaxID=133901 RepID=A0A6J1T5Z6_FRAOC|nr:eukaryotic translation initiation factor 3 subunit J [Frankliniella occidentalis]KAE8753125.1 hypothetical protein FOCC_FOCC000048 [Frankliniella occidentalis]